MHYLLLIYDAEKRDAEASPAEMDALRDEYGRLAQEMQQAGVLVGGEELHPTTAATSVRLRDGKVLHTDGPFAETKEQLGGYFVVDCENLDQALAWAAKIPNARSGTVEVRPAVADS